MQFIKNDLLGVTMWQPYDSRLDKLTKTFVTKLFITDLAGKNWHEPLPQERAMSRVGDKLSALANPAVLDALPNDPDHILVISDELGTSGDVFKVNVRTNRAERIHRADDKIAGYVTDLEGNLRARTRADVDARGAFIAAEIREPGGGELGRALPLVREGARRRPDRRLRQGPQHRLRAEQRRARQDGHLRIRHRARASRRRSCSSTASSTRTGS